MPSASGVYSLPPGYLAVTGTTIQASQHNPSLEDIAQALTNRLSRDGTAPMTGALQGISGTVGAPGYIFSIDPTSGFYKTTSGIGVAIGGVKVAEFLAGGIKGARLIGEMVPYSGSLVPALWVLPNGQTLSRTVYPDLWAFAQAEIGTGTSAWNNGDGSTTFGVPDLRGRALICNDALGGVAANRTTNATMAPNGTQIGSVGGAQQITLAMTNLPASPAPVTAATSQPQVNGSSAVAVGNGAPTTNILSGGGAVTSLFASNTFGVMAPMTVGSNTANLGSATPLTNIPPAVIVNYLLYAGA